MVFDAGTLFEGTGKYGRSTLRRVDWKTGAVLQQTVLPRELFGEGITVWGDEIVQLSWKAHRGLRYDRANFSASVNSICQGRAGESPMTDGIGSSAMARTPCAFWTRTAQRRYGGYRCAMVCVRSRG